MKADPVEVLRRMASPFFEQDPAPLFVSVCCKRLFVGRPAPTICRTCSNKPKVLEVADLTELDQVAAALLSS